jgi:hypothetical protein
MNIIAAAVLGAVLAGPPSGRPPIGPLERYEPRLYDVKFTVDLNTAIPYGQDDPRWGRHPKDDRPIRFGGTFQLADTPIIMPLVFQGTYHRIDHTTVRPQLWLGGQEDRSLGNRFRIDETGPHHGAYAVIPIVQFRGQLIRWSVRYRMKSYSSRINEAGAQSIPWPREWPSEVSDGLAPQLFIESGDPIFKETVDRVSEGKLRLVPPYLAAKDLVRYCINELQLSGSPLYRGRAGVLHGLNVNGAAWAAREGRGNPNDLVCVCVAMLRAAGIPARPVIGVEEDERDRAELVVWAEMYLPGAGWIPFDPIEMRGKSVRHRNVKDPWPEFGSMKDLNERIPLAYHFIPPKAVQSPQRPAVWGWDPRPKGETAEQRITIGVSSLGRLPEDDR